MGEQDGIILDDLRTVSENDPGDIPSVEETPPENEDGAGDPADQPAEPGESTGGSEQEPGDDTEDPGEEDKEDSPVVIIQDGDSKEWQEEITERLTELMKPKDNTDVTERLDALIQMLTPEEDELEAYAVETVPVEGYETFQYPVKVEYAVLFAGYEEYFIETQTYDDPEIFKTDYEDFAYECSKPGSSFKDFYISCIYDANNDIAYEINAPEPEPDPGDEEQKETVEQLLSYLEGINTTLSDMVQADAEYYQLVKDYQTEMLEMQAVNTATNIFIVIGVFAVFAAMIWQQFLGRFK